MKSLCCCSDVISAVEMYIMVNLPCDLQIILLPINVFYQTFISLYYYLPLFVGVGHYLNTFFFGIEIIIHRNTV